MFIAATVPVERAGQTSPIMDAALAIGQSEKKPATTTETPTSAVDPAPGTFERFMGSFGTPARWAGR